MEIKCSVCRTIIEADSDMLHHDERQTDLCTNPACVRADILGNLTLKSLHDACEEHQSPLIALQVLQEGIESLSTYQVNEIVQWFQEEYMPCFNGDEAWQSA